jgi:hypothetical protein
MMREEKERKTLHEDDEEDVGTDDQSLEALGARGGGAGVFSHRQVGRHKYTHHDGITNLIVS